MHLSKILALGEIYGREPTARAIEDALVFNAFSSEYIAHLLEVAGTDRTRPASPLSLTRRPTCSSSSCRNPIYPSTRSPTMSDDHDDNERR